jgi:ABC-type multidrug transport system fused ATPase/permease subunit
MPEIKKSRLTKEGLVNVFKLFRYLHPYRVEYTLGMLFLLGGSLASLAVPKFLGDLVNSGNEGKLMQDISIIALMLAALFVLQALFSYFRTILFVNVTEKSMADLRRDTFSHLIRLPMSFFDEHRVGELNSRISADVSLVQETLTSTLADFIRQIVIIIGGITVLILTAPQLTLFMLAIIPVAVILVFIFGRFIRRLSKDAQKRVAESNTIVEETLQGIRSVKAYTNEFFEINRYRSRIKEVARIGMKSGKYRGAFSAFLVLGLFGSLVAVIWKGATLMSAGEMAVGDLFEFVIYTVFIGGNIGGVASVITRMQRFVGATEDLFEMFHSEEEKLEKIDKLPDEQVISGHIEFEDLSFYYPTREEEVVLEKINLDILPNQIVALVGSSGAGKSTLASLLLGLYLPTSGKLLFDGKDSRDFSISVLRHQIALVPQDIFLFGGTIGENIAYGKPGAPEDDIIEAARLANAWEFISRFPDGLDTIVGERGTQVSGGQRQRIAIARAILNNPRILILDEATSSLDSESERLVQEGLDQLMKGRTSIVIAHRLSTIRNADKIVVLENGRIVEEGTHHQLMDNGEGIYKKLTEMQAWL